MLDKLHALYVRVSQSLIALMWAPIVSAQTLVAVPPEQSYGWVIGIVIIIGGLVGVIVLQRRAPKVYDSVVAGAKQLEAGVQAGVSSLAKTASAVAPTIHLPTTNDAVAMPVYIPPIAAPAVLEITPGPATVPAVAPPASPVPVPVPSAVPVPEYPKVVVTNGGTHIKVDAPLNPQYEVGMMGRILAGSFAGPGGGWNGVNCLSEPSNGGHVGMPLRSAAGFPLGYAIANGVVVGTPSVMYMDQSFNSDSEVLDYIKRTTQTPEQLAEANRQWAEYDARKKAAIAANTVVGPIPAQQSTEIPIGQVN